ncbi:hypothetical protein LMG28614_04469 [Paraburkholderia ultramafica]|uniref:Uncharacterized protein n=1 Tax=Paraburkholderia ultramafica TaxID=1544867 RepID=A0A6S7D5W1_9BURK|nr:hypothetical protein [Paraburkholderia ultramafica]CAB3796910.1 hypothetical protein LMG28614_04469 [Paraburkholderia ultramafica]
MLKQYVGHEAGDPAKLAQLVQLVLKLAYHNALPAHLLLGSDALHDCGEGDKARADALRAASAATDFCAPAPLPAFPPASGTQV